jgi:ubiquinone/menaquinone biosynthesis C-methylase UbiE
MKWFEENYVAPLERENIRVLDIGSYDVNGTYKDIFSDPRYKYTGLDVEAGPNVDVVLENPYDWSSLETDTFDVVISGQALEHIEFFWITMAEMTRVLKKDGLICIIAPNGFDEHRYPVDCYRFFSDGLVALARYAGLEAIHAHTNCAPESASDEWYSLTRADSMLVAKKTYSGAARFADLKTYKCIPGDHEKLRTGMLPFKLKFRESELAHKYLDGLRGIEIGGSAHNPFGLNTINVDSAGNNNSYYKSMEVMLNDESLKVDVIADGDRLPFSDKSFDFVISSHVIEHFYDPIKALLEWARVARKYIVVVVPHRMRTRDVDRELTPVINLHKRHHGLMTEKEDCRDDHWSVFEPANFNELCVLCGFNVVEIQDPDDKVGNGFTFVIKLD